MMERELLRPNQRTQFLVASSARPSKKRMSMRSFGYINSNFRDWKSAYDAGELEFEEEKGRETLERRTERDVTFCIDRGGTFTDVYCEYRSNEKKRKQTISLKLLSEDRNYASAPAEGIRRILEKIEKRTIGRDEKTPTRRIKSVRMGTTVGTNALLERKGAKVALVVTKGFRDLLTIGNQARPDIFKLSAIRPKALAEISIEANERVRPVKCSDGGEYYYHRRLSSDSNDSNAFHRSSTIVDASDVKTNEEIEIVEKFDAEALRGQLLEAKANGFTSIAAVLMHSYAYPNHEIAIGKLAEEIGFEQISLSSALTPMARAVSRGHTAAVDAYLTPKIKEYIKQFVQGFDDGLVRDVPVLFMQSDGGMTSADRFCGYKAILSGPAGGVVGYSRTATSQGEHAAVIGFDMGGTSTDVSRYDPKQGYEHVTETITAGVVVQCPQLDISTVAAGGGSKLKFFAGSFQVGPESVGSEPGPACYRKGGDLAVTDANVVLGRVLPEHFPKIFGPDEDEELDRTASLKKFELLRDEINDWFHERERQKNSDNNNNNNSRSSNSNNSGSHINLTTEDVAMGFLRVANEAMCRPIREITESKGFETSKHVLAAFGGAGPQHACAVAKALGIKSIKVHKYSGILSAFGMGLADVVRDKQTACFAKYSKENEEIFENTAKELREIVKRELMEEEGFSGETIETELYLNMRFEGTDAPMMIREPTFQSGRSFLDEFREKFRAEYGFVMENRDAIVDDVRVRGVAKSEVNNNDSTVEKELSASEEGSRISSLEQRQKSLTRTYFEGRGWMETPVFELLDLYARDEIIGPAIILNGSSTCIIEPDCFTLVTDSGDLEITVNEGASSSTSSSSAITKNSIEEDVKGDLFDESAFAHKIADPVLVSLYNNRFMGIAEQMGRTLQRTAVSTNIKERLDFSCAIFSPSGGLVANAPHVPVHLGAMSSTVSWQLNHLKDDLHDGDVIVTNHPCSGGSHLPDITVVTPVFSNNTLEFLVASRGHHADVGGATPGSMPPFSTKLSEEGVAIESFKILKRGTYDEEGLVQILKAGKARKIEDNLNDLRAQVAANARGIQLIRELMRDAGTNETREYMRFCQINAELAVRETLKAFASKILAKRNDTTSDQVIVKASDFMDDGSEIKLSLTLNSKDGSAIFDFAGTSPEVLGNWNAPPAVTVAAVIYALRCIVDEPIPLNQGCLTPVDVRIPDGCFLSPSPTAAVVGGNVLTSQRVTDVIFEAFEAAANSQGCMNNFTFGDESFGYYETIGGGAGAGPDFAGASGTQTHMTNTRITDVEILERRYPVLVNTFALRKDSGGEGKHKGGDGLIREFTFLKPLVANVLSERRERNPRGLLGGCDGERGLNLLKKNGREDFEVIGGKVSLLVEAGDVLRIETPGGGGFGLK